MPAPTSPKDASIISEIRWRSVDDAPRNRKLILRYNNFIYGGIFSHTKESKTGYTRHYFYVDGYGIPRVCSHFLYLEELPKITQTDRNAAHINKILSQPTPLHEVPNEQPLIVQHSQTPESDHPEDIGENDAHTEMDEQAAEIAEFLKNMEVKQHEPELGEEYLDTATQRHTVLPMNDDDDAHG